jgi:hypothetical protein
MTRRQERERLYDQRAISPDASLSARAFARVAIAALMFGYVALGARSALAQEDDDWSVVPNQSEPRRTESHQGQSPQQSPPAQAEPVPPHALRPQLQPAADGARMVCGEMARPAAAYKSIVANIEREWGADAPVYESLRAGSPHVLRGGCIFYNPAFMESFLGGETDEHGEPDKTAMIYAIMAHELGHLEHHDYDRTQISSVEKELEADRFSGYTLARLGISRANITAYYSMGGDEFSGVHDHGFSNQRIAAFDTGWKRAEWHQAEDSSATARSVANNAAPDDSGEADDSSTAAVP